MRAPHVFVPSREERYDKFAINFGATCLEDISLKTRLSPASVATLFAAEKEKMFKDLRRSWWIDELWKQYGHFQPHTGTSIQLYQIKTMKSYLIKISFPNGNSVYVKSNSRTACGKYFVWPFMTTEQKEAHHFSFGHRDEAVNTAQRTLPGGEVSYCPVWGSEQQAPAPTLPAKFRVTFLSSHQPPRRYWVSHVAGAYVSLSPDHKNAKLFERVETDGIHDSVCRFNKFVLPGSVSVLRDGSGMDSRLRLGIGHYTERVLEVLRRPLPVRHSVIGGCRLGKSEALRQQENESRKKRGVEQRLKFIENRRSRLHVAVDLLVDKQVEAAQSHDTDQYVEQRGRGYKVLRFIHQLLYAS